MPTVWRWHKNDLLKPFLHILQLVQQDKGTYTAPWKRTLKLTCADMRAHTRTHAHLSLMQCLPALIKGLFSTQHSPPVLNISTHTCTHCSSRQNTTTEEQTEEEIVSTLTFHLSSTLICQSGCCSDFLSAAVFSRHL